MNCREAERLIFAERDGALDPAPRAALAAHIVHCAECRSQQARLAAAAEVWRQADAAVRTPPVETEWHAIRRRIREEVAPRPAQADWRRPVWWSVASAAAALLVAVFLGPRWFASQGGTSARDWAYVSYVEVENASGAAMVYEDAQSGWLVVWVGDDGARAGS